jgi:hypothetical protein
MRKSSIFSLTMTSSILLCVGCDAPARKHQAEQARRQQVVDDLKSLGKAMHNKQGSESTTDSSVTNAPEKVSDAPPE